MNKQGIMVIIVIGALVLYVWGLVVIGSASLSSTDDESPVVSGQWVDVVAAVTTVLAMNAGAYFGLPDQTFQKLLRFNLNDPEVIRGIATLIYFVALIAAFLVAVSSRQPHPSLTDMAGTLVGFLTGVLTVFLGKV